MYEHEPTCALPIHAERQPPATVGESATAHDGTAVHWTELMHALSACSHRLRDEWSRHLDGVGISDAEFALLWACRSAPGGMHQAQIASCLAISPAHVSQLAEQLRARLLLEPRRGPPDRRRQYWIPTPQGASLMDHALGRLAAWARQREAAFGTANRAALLNLIRALSVDHIATRKAS